MMFEGELDEENNPDYKIKVSDWKECGADQRYLYDVDNCKMSTMMIFSW